MLEASLSAFATDTAVTKRDQDLYDAEVTDRWNVIDGAAPNGGYLTAMACRALADNVTLPDPVGVTAQFLSPVKPGPVTITTAVLRHGSRHATATAQIRQNDTIATQVTATFADLGRADGVTKLDRKPPVLPAIDDCIDTNQYARTHAPETSPPIMERFDHRQPASVLSWVNGTPSGTAENGGYLRWSDGTAMDVFGLLVVVDCHFPAVFNSAAMKVGWVPTLELNIQIRARPTPGFLTTWFRTQAITAGYLEEDGEVWDQNGNLIALSRQLALQSR
jgi:acyl-CoA thioesterase